LLSGVNATLEFTREVSTERSVGELESLGNIVA